jgi:3-oxoacyl-[acyl-carrier-protein] synthase II
MQCSASRPFDKARDGFVIGEGAAVLVLEELEHARRRGATPLAEVLGYGLAGDGHHITAPSPDGDGARRAMLAALRSAGLSQADVGYVNAHATSTPAGDAVEVLALRGLVGGGPRSSPLLVSSTKGATGHLLGAAGAIEALFTVMALSEGVVPATKNLESTEIDVGDAMELVGDGKPRPCEGLTVAMSNSFGFGGVNVSLLFGKAPPL